MNERLKQLRKHLGLSQEAFGKKIGITKVSVSQFEHGDTKPSGATLLNIYREFNVSRDWLENGEGEMFQELSTEEELAYLTGQVLSNGSPRQIKVLKILAKMGPERWKQVEDFIDYIQSELAEEEKQEKGGDN